MSDPTPLLQFHQVAIEANPLYESAVCDITFDLVPGGLLLILMEPENQLLPLADAAEGLVEPLQGRVEFLNTDWRTLSADRATRARAKIGRIFPESAWVNNLDLDENITLAQRHHTRRSIAEIFDEAAALARQFGLPGLPLGSIANFRRQDLQKAACVRAFLGDPVLIIAEDPTRHVFADIMAPLVNHLHTARRRGAAVLWTTTNPKIWNDPGIKPTARCRMAGSQMELIEEAV